MSAPTRVAAFLDRDGVINTDRGYVSCWKDFEFLPRAIEGLQQLQRLGFELIIVTNQSGIGRGYYSEAAFRDLNAAMQDHLRGFGVTLSAIYHCPHHPEHGQGEYQRHCDCRKPAPGMILRGLAEHQLAAGGSILVGDKPSDITAGEAAGLARCYHVTNGDAAGSATPVTSLAAAARLEATLAERSDTLG